MFLVASAFVDHAGTDQTLLKGRSPESSANAGARENAFRHAGALLAHCCPPSSPRRRRLLAPSVTFTRTSGVSFARVGDRQELRTMRVTVLVFSAFVLCYAICRGPRSMKWCPGRIRSPWSAAVPLYSVCTGSVQPLRARFFQLCWGSWRGCCFWSRRRAPDFPAQLADCLASLVGMVVGSVGPQAIRNSHGSHHKLAGTRLVRRLFSGVSQRAALSN